MARRIGIITQTPPNQNDVFHEMHTLIKFREKLAKNFMDILVLKKLKTAGSIRGCGIKNFLRREIQIPIDPKTVYLFLYSLEKNGLVRKKEKNYTLTRKGKETIEAITRANDKIQWLVRNVF